MFIVIACHRHQHRVQTRRTRTSKLRAWNKKPRQSPSRQSLPGRVESEWEWWSSPVSVHPNAYITPCLRMILMTWRSPIAWRQLIMYIYISIGFWVDGQMMLNVFSKYFLMCLRLEFRLLAVTGSSQTSQELLNSVRTRVLQAEQDVKVLVNQAAKDSQMFDWHWWRIKHDKTIRN